MTSAGYVSKVIFNNSDELDVESNSIVVFVGPNNVGKTQILKDILALCDQKQHTTVVRDIVIHKNEKRIDTILQEFAKVKSLGDHKEYNFLNGASASIYDPDSSDDRYREYSGYSYYWKFFVAMLDTDKRLGICSPAPNVNRDETKNNPIQYVAFNDFDRNLLSDNFKKIFNVGIVPDIWYGAQIPLRIGSIPTLGEYNDEFARQAACGEMLKNLPQVQLQGDGMRSMAGMLLYLILRNYSTYLIDEPESFLHPPQAFMAGKIIGEIVSSDQQVFISTHSEQVLKGLLESASDRVKIVRVTRNKNINKFYILNNDEIQSIIKDQLIRYSNILSGIFYNSVVLCESESDCRMYSIMHDHIKEKENQFSETLFVQCHGKDQFSKMEKIMKNLNDNFHIIVDMDILNDKDKFKKLAESVGIVWRSIADIYDSMMKNIPKEEMSKKEFLDKVNDLLFDLSDNSALTNTQLKKIRGFASLSTWSYLKEKGVDIFDSEAVDKFEKINSIFKEKNIHIVPVGELESFVPCDSLHGPAWVEKVIKTYPNLENHIYDNLRNFITDMNLI